MAKIQGEVLFKKERDTGNNDIWDDTALIKAYDEAVNAMQDKLVERGIEKPENTTNPRDKKKKKKSKNKSKERKSQKPKPVGTGSEWYVGDYCRAVYTEDGEIYEAVILSVDNGQETCFIRYLGYGNEEEQMLVDLMPSVANRPAPVQDGSLGQAQSRDARSQLYLSETCSEDLNEIESSDGRAHMHRKITAKTKSHRHRTTTSSIESTPLGGRPGSSYFGEFMPPPPSVLQAQSSGSMPYFMPPPGAPSRMGYGPTLMPPFGNLDSMGSQNFAKIPPPPPLDDFDLVENDKEALHSMLISWYMSGYHTGYYQGLKAGKMSKSKEKPK